MQSAHARVMQQFANRFERDGEAYVFRASLSAPGYAVDAATRDRLVSEFNRRYLWLVRVTVVLVVLIFTAVAWFLVARAGEVPDPVTWLILGGGLGLHLLPFYWLWNAPLRELRDWTPTVEGRSRLEARRLALRRLTWGRLGAAVLLIPFTLWRASARINVFVGWGRLWLVFCGAALGLVAVQAIRKLRMERSGASRNAPGG